jgi:hypothetical protein
MLTHHPECTDRTRRLSMTEGPWFFCLKHHTVEPRDGCAERHRLGPYETRAQAERAVDSVAEREQKLTAEDRAWEGD